MRSGTAYAALALEAASRDSAVTFVALGCFGATVPVGLERAYSGIEPDVRLGDLPPQLDEVRPLAGRRQIDALLLSVGANDIYFGAVARFCARVVDCPQRRLDPTHRRLRHPTRRRPAQIKS